VAIDVSPLLYGGIGGIGRMTRRLVEGILTEEMDFEFMLFGRRLLGEGAVDLPADYPIKRLRLPRSFEPLIKRLRLIETLCPADLYHATDFYMPLGRKARVVATIHDLIFLIEPEAMVDHKRLARWVPEFSARCERILTISEYSKKDIVEQFRIDPERVHVTYPGFERQTFFPEPDREALRDRLEKGLGLTRSYFLSVSCSTGRKNTPFLLAGYERLLGDDPANDLVLVWDPPPEIRRQYGAGRLKDRIHFVGRQPDAVLRDLYCGATAIMFPSLYEGFGLPILEAMACGTPVISSSTSSMPEVGGDAAIYIDPRDQVSLLDAMRLFENGDRTVAALPEKSLRQAARFSWERCVSETLAVYRRCFGN
jgi:glycosyltransferase involved in cell wall biosynthesis